MGDLNINKSALLTQRITTNALFLVASLIFALTTNYIPRIPHGNKRTYEKEVPTAIIDNFLSEEMILELHDWIKSERRFSSNVANTARGIVSVGEEEPVRPDGSCLHKDFITYDGKICHYDARSNVFRHHAITGGLYGAKETLAKLSSSVYAFYPESLLSGNYYPNEVNNPIIQKLFNSERFQMEANKLCSEGLDLPLHWDNQWYWGVNERSAPNWLLHTMKESGLFEDIVIPQAQGVAYLHGTKDEPTYEHGGRYIYYPNGPGSPAKTVKPKRGQAIIMDGGRTIHGVERTHPGVINNYLRKDAFNRMEYQGNETWYLLSDDDLIDVYKTTDFRITLTWRGLCFRNQEEEIVFNHQLQNRAYRDNIEILKILDDDLHRRGEVPNEKNLDNTPRKDFIDILQRVYMPYPVESLNAWFPINYCAFSHDNMFLKILLKPFCQDIHIAQPKNENYPKAKVLSR